MAIAVVGVLLAAASARAGEAPPAANIVFVEFAGNCVMGSANYERTVAERLLIRVGLGLLPVADLGRSGGVVIEQVGTLGTLFGNGRHSAELALGAALWEPSDGSRWGVYATAVIGYRYRSEVGNVFRVGATPLLRLRSWSDEQRLAYAPLFGLSFGQTW